MTDPERRRILHDAGELLAEAFIADPAGRFRRLLLTYAALILSGYVLGFALGWWLT